MYSFEGQFRNAPIQSLRGASKKEERVSLIKRAQEERKKREDQKTRVSSAIIIQAFYRATKERDSLKNLIRNEFDVVLQKIQKNLSIIQTCPVCMYDLTRQLVFFFSVKRDAHRLVSICQLFIQYQVAAVQCIVKDTTHLYQLKQLLWRCCRLVMGEEAGSVQLVPPLRLLEVYTKPPVFLSSMNPEQSSNVAHHILNFLISKGYYQCMRVLLEKKVPPCVERTTHPPTPAASSILDLILLPLCQPSTTQHLQNEVYCSLCEALLCRPMGEQILNFLLPTLATRLTAQHIKLLLHSLAVASNSSYGSLWLLHSLFTLVSPHIGVLNVQSLQYYVQLLGQLCSHLQPPPSITKTIHIEDSDDEDDYGLMDTYSIRAELVTGCVSTLNNPAHVAAITSLVTNSPNAAVMVQVCTLCHTLHRLLKRPVHQTRLLYSLAFKNNFLRSLWQTCTTLKAQTVMSTEVALMQQLARGSQLRSEDDQHMSVLMSVFSLLFGHSLLSLHDSEFLGLSTTSHSLVAFSVSELVQMTLSLRDVCLGLIELAHPEVKPTVREDYKAAFLSVGADSWQLTQHDLLTQVQGWAYLFKVVSQLLKQVYARDNRQKFCPQGHWLAPHVQINADKPSQLYRSTSNAFRWHKFATLSSLNPNRMDEMEGVYLTTQETRHLTILTELPFVVSFQERVKILQRLLAQDRREHQGDMRHLAGGPMIQIQVRRNYLYEDAFDRLSPDNEPNMKLKMQVQLKNFAGLDEAGIDGGGLFREFISELMKAAFDPNRGFFKYTSDKLLYPNPEACILVENYKQHYFFLGRILGKALFENMLIEMPFANFFLNKLLSRHAGNVDIHHLASLDPEMYKNLLFLKNYEGDVADLGLDFTVVNNDLGEAQIEDLKPGGKDIIVDNHNVIEYIHLMADYRLNRQIRPHCHAFRQGLADVVNIDWLRMFDPRELQVLISGAPIPVDLEDLRKHTHYSGGYDEDHPVIQMFWRVLEEFSDRERRHLLMFVTSCSRPPLLGFKDLYPAFCVQHGGQELDRLPSASTCMNLLKLPEFPSEDVLRQKLSYAINSGAGFELS